MLSRKTSAFLIPFILASLAQAFDSTGVTNDFYDNAPVHHLRPGPLTVEGEIADPGRVRLDTLPLRSVIVKETVLKDGRDAFVGAYRYDGYSLYDILNSRILKKKNHEEFPRCIDMYVVVEAKGGQRAVFSWGEIYYPANRHRILIASRVSRIVPSLTKELWPLPEKSRVVAALDLITERNIPEPVRIVVRSFPRSFTVNKGMKPLLADTVRIMQGDSLLDLMTVAPDGLNTVGYESVFYGRGKGIHGVSTFEGALLRDVIDSRFPRTIGRIRQGLFCVAAVDGYRCTFTYSEVCNRNDQAQTLFMVLAPGENGGRYKLFPAADFFSDRAVKAISSIHYIDAR